MQRRKEGVKERCVGEAVVTERDHMKLQDQEEPPTQKKGEGKGEKVSFDSWKGVCCWWKENEVWGCLYTGGEGRVRVCTGKKYV